MAAQRHSRVAVRLARLLGPDCAIVGGMAVNAHGYLRATRDVDVMVLVPLAEARRRLSAAGVDMPTDVDVRRPPQREEAAPAYSARVPPLSGRPRPVAPRTRRARCP
jgi:hypothetical protein